MNDPSNLGNFKTFPAFLTFFAGYKRCITYYDFLVIQIFIDCFCSGVLKPENFKTKFKVKMIRSTDKLMHSENDNPVFA